MDTEIERNAAIIEKAMKEAHTRGIWTGAILALLLGLAIGYGIAYHTIDRTVIVPLSQGIKT